VFVFKATFLIFLMMWMRWSLPRLRIDQVMNVCLKYFLPISCVLLLGVCFWQLLAPPWLETGWRYLSAFGSVGFVLFVLVKVFTSPLAAGRGQLPGVWAGMKTPLTQGK